MVGPAIISGDALILLRPDHVDDLTNDNCVDVSLLIGLVPAAQAGDAGQPDAGGPMAYLDADGNGTIDSGSTLDISQASYDPMTNQPLTTARTQIVNGHLVAMPNGGLSLNLAGLVLQLGTAEVGFDVSAGALTNGDLGGALPAKDFADTVASLLSPGGDPTMLETAMAKAADLASGATGNTCDLLSLGVTFQAVGAVPGVDHRTP